MIDLAVPFMLRVCVDPKKRHKTLITLRRNTRNTSQTWSLLENACPVLRQRQRESLPVLRHAAVRGLVSATHVRGSRSQTLTGHRCRHYQATYCRRGIYTRDTGDHRVQTRS